MLRRNAGGAIGNQNDRFNRFGSFCSASHTLRHNIRQCVAKKQRMFMTLLLSVLFLASFRIFSHDLTSRICHPTFFVAVWAHERPLHRIILPVVSFKNVGIECERKFVSFETECHPCAALANYLQMLNNHLTSFRNLANTMLTCYPHSTVTA